MGTRSLTVMHDDADNYDGEEIVVMYRQMDGYPSGHGQELRDFLSNIVIVNGIGLSDNRRIANGGSCLAAQIVAHFKDEVGGFYLYPAGTRDCGEEYIYHVYPSVKHGNIKVTSESPYDDNSGDSGLDKFGRVWYNDGRKGDNVQTSTSSQYPMRYSVSKGEWIPVDQMHPCHILNAMRKELRQEDNEEVLNDPMFKAYFDVLKDASL